MKGVYRYLAFVIVVALGLAGFAYGSAFDSPANYEPYEAPVWVWANGQWETHLKRKTDGAICRPLYFDGADRIVIGKPPESFAGLNRDENGNVAYLIGSN